MQFDVFDRMTECRDENAHPAAAPKSFAADWPCLHTLVEHQARLRPMAVAVCHAGAAMSYGELDERGDRIAQLLHDEGVKPGDRVATCLPNGLPFAAAVLGVLKAGCVLTPLDHRLTDERLHALVGDAGAHIVITDAAPRWADRGHRCLDVQEPPPLRAGFTRHSCRADAPAYLLFTSGSTGQRKGVLNHHAGVASHMAWLKQATDLPADASFLMRTSHIFDVWLLEFFGALANGHRLVLADTDRSADPSYLIQLIRDEHIANINVVPALLRRIVEQPGFETLESLRFIHSGGEVLDPALARAAHVHPGVTLYNLYGPTEASVIAIVHRLIRENEAASVPIGHPLPNTPIVIVDDDLVPVRPGDVGEICIGGVSTGLGYIGASEDAQACFIDDGVLGEGRFYRTGDLGYVRADGSILFVGRKDGRIKLGGIRVETAEIEAALHDHPDVADCAVAVQTMKDESRRLLAHVVPASGTVDPSALARHVRQLRPDALIYPSAFLAIDSLPTLPSGKHDHRALPIPDMLPRSLPHAVVPPRHGMEQVVAGIWTRHLSMTGIGTTDDFYELGGNPLIAADLMVTIRNRFGDAGAVREAAQLSTIADMAASFSIEN